MKDEAAEELSRLGLKEYQSRVYSALASLGPSGVTDINRQSGVPRTKIYETLQELISRGLVEFQPGRPVVYRAVPPAIVVNKLTEEYLNSAKKAKKLLEGQYESVVDIEQDLVWIVRGDTAVRRKLAEVVSKAKKSVLILETYPPVLIPSVKSLLKAASNKRVYVRTMCVVSEGQNAREFVEPDLIRYKALPSIEAPGRKRMNTRVLDPYMRPLSLTFSRPYAVAIIDETEAFVMMQNPTDGTRSLGFSARILGVPSILAVMFEQISTMGRNLNAR